MDLIINRYGAMYPDIPPPNRLMWRFFMCRTYNPHPLYIASCSVEGYRDSRPRLTPSLCGSHGCSVVRQCLDLAHYEMGPAIGTASLADFTNQSFSKLAHTDMTPVNMVLGDWSDLQDPEHTVTPTLKLIDFGWAKEMDTELAASAENIRDIGEVSPLCTHAPRNIPVQSA